jgi:thioredoxin 1
MTSQKPLLVALIAVGVFSAIVAGESKTNKSTGQSVEKTESPIVTFVELGSVNCIPCRQMQPVMKAIQGKYGSQVNVVFHDVWTEAGKPAASRYRIRLIPTQVFLDKEGNEFFRHEGFFPEAEIDKLLQKQGLRIKKQG